MPTSNLSRLRGSTDTGAVAGAGATSYELLPLSEVTVPSSLLSRLGGALSGTHGLPTQTPARDSLHGDTLGELPTGEGGGRSTSSECAGAHVTASTRREESATGAAAPVPVPAFSSRRVPPHRHGGTLLLSRAKAGETRVAAEDWAAPLLLAKGAPSRVRRRAPLRRLLRLK
jgi:hypothetical protein